jgi:hypothetical protein
MFFFLKSRGSLAQPPLKLMAHGAIMTRSKIVVKDLEIDLK